MAEKEQPSTSIEDNLDKQVDDKVYDYWQKNKGGLIASGVLFVCIVVAFQGLRFYRSYAEEQVQQAFIEASAQGNLRAFSREHTGHRLAGLAALEVAHQDFRAGDYAGAIEGYDIAINSLSGTNAGDRAALGKASSLYQIGEFHEGRALFQSLARDERVADDIRIQAFFHLGVLAVETDETDRVDEIIRSLESIPGSSGWVDRLDQLR